MGAHYVVDARWTAPGGGREARQVRVVSLSAFAALVHALALLPRVDPRRLFVRVRRDNP